MSGADYPEMASAFRTILYVMVIPSFVVLAGIALRWSLADVYATQLSHHLHTLNNRSTNKNAEQWRLARQHLEKSLELRPVYARYFELGEKFYQKLDMLEADKNPLIKELAWHKNEEKALDYARRGLRLMPSWPYLWKQLVLSKLTLKQFDDELTGAFERAVYLGPWERSVQNDLVILGLNEWRNLSSEARLSVASAINQILLRKNNTAN
jgi:hypothetical protein